MPLVLPVGPSIPIFVAASAEFTSTGVPTAILPTGHLANDILVLALQSSNDALVAAPAGYTQLGPQNGIGAAAAAGANRLSLFWKRDGGSESAPTIPDTGDHTYGMMFAVRGCPTIGDPFALGGNKFKLVTSTAGSGCKSVTTVDNVLVVDVFAGSADNAGAEGSSLANTDLGSVTEQFDDGTTDGTGGFLYVVSGTKAEAGEVKATTVTWANTSVDLCTRIHFLPADTVEKQNASRGCECQVFIGSPTDLDDTWVKPTSARRVHVQVCGGGGGGSSGRNAATAAGGGGGGGGGFTDRWFMADDLAATVLLHAGKGGAATANSDGAVGNAGVASIFGKGLSPVLVNQTTGTAATAAATGDGGNGGCGGGSGSMAVVTARAGLNAGTPNAALGDMGASGGSGTTAPVGGSPAERGGGGGESGGDTDGAVAANGDSMWGGGGGASGRAVGTISVPGSGGGATAPATGATPSVNGVASSLLPFGGSGAGGGNATTGTGGTGGFPGGGGGGGGTASGTQAGGAGGHGCIVVTTYF